MKHGLESERRGEWGCLAVGEGVGSEGWRGTAGDRGRECCGVCLEVTP